MLLVDENSFDTLVDIGAVEVLEVVFNHDVRLVKGSYGVSCLGSSGHRGLRSALSPLRGGVVIQLGHYLIRRRFVEFLFLEDLVLGLFWVLLVQVDPLSLAATFQLLILD